jgi:hypothetical protein
LRPVVPGVFAELWSVALPFERECDHEEQKGIGMCGNQAINQKGMCGNPDDIVKFGRQWMCELFPG